MGKTVVLGATPNSHRYAFVATERLKEHGHEVIPVGIRSGTIGDMEIMDLKDKPEITNVDTVTLYISPQNQEEWMEYIFSLKPRRIVFNPGTENPEFVERAHSKSIETINACTLVMLSVGNY